MMDSVIVLRYVKGRVVSGNEVVLDDWHPQITFLALVDFQFLLH